RRWCPGLMAAIALGVAGCTQATRRPQAGVVDGNVRPAAFHPPDAAPPVEPMAVVVDPPQPELAGTQPLEILIQPPLPEDRSVQAAFHNVQSLTHRIPQVMTLDDPFVSNTIFPIPSVAPQYSLMGYNPYNMTLAQQFPWCGTLRLRGAVAEGDVQIALAELAAAQLDTVAAVKRAYYSLYASERSEEILSENRKILEDFRTIARERLASGGAQQDVLRSEVLLSELDRELANNRQGIVM